MVCLICLGVASDSEDVLTPPENSHYLAEKIAGAGHGAMFQERDRFVEVVMDFLK